MTNHDPDGTAFDLDIDRVLTTPPPAPLCWRTPPRHGAPTWEPLDATTAVDHWQQLREWVEWLVERYALDTTTVPGCWYQHPPQVEELTALWRAWQSAYHPTATGDAALHWHDHLDQTRTRLRDWAARGGCRPGDHTPHPVPAAVEDEERAWRDHLHRNTDHRP